PGDGGPASGTGVDPLRPPPDDAGPAGDLCGDARVPRPLRVGIRARPAGAEGTPRGGPSRQPADARRRASRRGGGRGAGRAERAFRGLRAMTFDRLLNLIVSTVIRRLVNGGINF